MSFLIDLDEPLTPEQDRRLMEYLRRRYFANPNRLTIVEVAAILRVSAATVHKMRELGQLSFKKVGGKWSISRAAFDRDLDALG